MHLLRRRNKWQRMVGKMTSGTGKSSAVRTGAAALTGIVTAVAASAAVSSARRKADS